MRAYKVDVGAQDPKLKNSPIVTEGDEDSEAFGQPLRGQADCYFNGVAFPNGSDVRSGTARLRCCDGIWIETGSADPDNP